MTATDPPSPRPSGSRTLSAVLDRLGRWSPVAPLVLVAAVLLPAVHSSLRFDDTGAFQLREDLRLSGTGFWEFEWNSFVSVVRDQRRIEPLAVLEGGAARWIFEDRLAYKLFLIAGTIAVVALLYVLVRRLAMSRSQAALVVTLVGGAMQFRIYHDPLLGYFGAMQILLVFLLGSLLAEERYLRVGGHRWLVASVTLFLCCLLLYEISPAFVVLPVALALARRPVLPALRVAGPYVLLALVFLLAIWLGRKGATVTGSGYATELRIGKALKTWLVHLIAPLPGSYMLFDPQHVRSDPTKAELLAAGWRAAVFFLLAAGLLLHRVGARPTSGRVLGTVALLGACLWIASPALVVLAPKYQDELVLGLGYLPTLAQTLGWGMVVAAGLVLVLDRAARWGRITAQTCAIAAALVLGAAAAVGFYGNQRVVAAEAATVAQRSLLADALGHGLARGLPRGTTLLMQNRDMAWPLGHFGGGNSTLDEEVAVDAGVLFDVRIVPPPDSFTCPPPAPMTFPTDCEPVSANAHWLLVRARRRGGTAILAGIRPPVARHEIGGAAQELRVFVSEAGRPPPVPLTGVTASGRPWSSHALRWRRLGGDGHWAIFAADIPRRGAPIASSITDPASKVDFTQPLTIGQAVRTVGTRRLLP